MTRSWWGSLGATSTNYGCLPWMSATGLRRPSAASIAGFHNAGGGLMLARDHMDLGSSLCGLGGVAAAHYFHTKQQPPETARHRDDIETTADIVAEFSFGVERRCSTD